MFNMKLIGMKISEYRKAKNFTQMELADLLNVSHQAVSNWERGETMPDISKLPELAEIFNTTIDNLLNSEKGSKILKQVVEGQKPEKVTVEEFKMVSPLLKPSHINDLSRELEVDDLDDVVSILPFIETETADQLVLESIDTLGASFQVESILPFVSENTADLLVSTFLEKNGDVKNPISILPFVRSETANNLIKMIIDKGGEISNMVSVLPFVDEEIADLVVTKHLDNKGDIENISAVLPFVSQQTADQLVTLYMEKGRIVPSHVLPFISSELANLLVLNKIKNK